MARRKRTAPSFPIDSAPLWYKDAILYELHVRAFADSDGDGIGDFRGLIGRLDYLQDLGVTALWLLPFYPSPLRDDGYDIADYTAINPIYGTLADFKLFLREAHRRGLRVITELVVNHTSDQHPWFQRARRAKAGSAERDFYVWSDTTDRYKEARIIFKDFESSNWTWDPVAGAYYWHRFYSHQPDLNYDNPKVHEAVLRALDFWLDLGVDGLRLDAVPYLYEREGTNCENLPETHTFLKGLRRHVDEAHPNRMLLAEANQWPEDAVAYFGQGDECHMAFHFPVMPRLFMAMRMEDRFPVLDILQQTPPIPDSCQWAMFLRNHDELTLEMVTDEDRDYMYRVYAQDPQARINLGIRRRLAPLLGNHRAKIELMNGLLFSLPGTPVLYYGDEIGMGDNIYLGDRNGVRTPMQWSAERNAGFSDANPQRLYLPAIIDPEYHFGAVNVEAQQNQPHSLLWRTKHLVALRKRFRAFGRGSLELLFPENPKVLAFVRRYQEETLLVVANLSRFIQYVELDLGAFKGQVPTEILGRTPFPPVGDLPYLLTLGPHAIYWFTLEPQRATTMASAAPDHPVPELKVSGRWESLLHGKGKASLEAVLPNYLRSSPWFGGRGSAVEAARVVGAIPVPDGSSAAQLALLRVDYTEGDSETYLLPLAEAVGPQAEQVRQGHPKAVVCRLSPRGKDGEGREEAVVYDALVDRALPRALLEAVARRRRLKGAAGELVAASTDAASLPRNGEPVPEPTVLNVEQSNTSVVFGDRWLLKVFRHVEEGVNPEVEIGRFLTERAGFRHVPPVVGVVECRCGRNPPMTVAVVQGYVPNEGDAWKYSLDNLGRYYERALTERGQVRELPLPARPTLELVKGELPEPARELIGSYLESARLMGQRTAELHLALASAPEVPEFAPEPITALAQRSLYQSLRSQARQALELLRKRLKDLPEHARGEAQGMLGREDEILRRGRSVLERRIHALALRHHGDYHLARLLYTGKDFVITGFEGEPGRPLSQRRLKRSPLRDVATMLRSFHYSAAIALRRGNIRPEDVPALHPWSRFWYLWVGVCYLKAYFEAAGAAAFLPRDPEDLRVLLGFYLLKRTMNELRYELTTNPPQAEVPLQALGRLLDARG